MYKPDTEYSSTNTAINGIDGKGMCNSDLKIFFPEYARGVSGEAGPKAGGQLKQYGSKYLGEKGYDFDYILNYYYNGSSSSRSLVVYFSY